MRRTRRTISMPPPPCARSSTRSRGSFPLSDSRVSPSREKSCRSRSGAMKKPYATGAIWKRIVTSRPKGAGAFSTTIGCAWPKCCATTACASAPRRPRIRARCMGGRPPDRLYCRHHPGADCGSRPVKPGKSTRSPQSLKLAQARSTFPKNTAMNDTTPKPPLPDHLCADPRSPHYVAAVFEQDVGIRLNGKERADVEEYCISEGWVKVTAGKAVDRHGKPLLIKLKGAVEAVYP